MFKIRVKNTPGNQKTGDQSEFGLVRNLASMQTNSQEAKVNDKMGAVPRDKATIEVEGGESVIGDVNNDGNMELMHFVGKRHNQGGVPVNIGEGSFIFSDTKSLIIKDEEVITKLFGLPFRKKGYTPSEISKNFDINKFVQILKDDSADEMSKRSAAEMLAKNKEKLGILAFIQESMKGFPDGIPQIAEEVMGKMGLNPEQIVQESQPQPPQEQQVSQEGQAPEQGMSPQDQEMMMAMMQQQEGAPMQEQMPMPEGEMMQGKFGGLMKFPTGGDAVKRITDKLYGAGYNANYMGNGKLDYRIPGAYNYNQLLETDTSKIDSLVNNPNPRYDGQSGFERGKIYTFKSRPDTYYKMGDDGKIYIKNKGTDWQYTPMDDPKGERRKVLEAGFNSGLTKEFVKTPAKSQGAATGAQGTSSTSIPGFGSKQEFDEYKKTGGKQAVAADLFYGALRSKDPNAMLQASKELLTNKDFDIDYSVSWLPFTDQDKIDDMSMILSEEASKLLNKKQKETVKEYSNNASTKVDEIIKHYNTQLKSIPYTDVSAKIAMQKKLDDAKKYKEVLQSGEYKEWLNDVNSSNPVTKPDFFGTPRWDGAFVSDRKADTGEWSRFHDYNQLTNVELLKNIDKSYAAIKGTKPIGKPFVYMDAHQTSHGDYESVSNIRDAIDNTYSDKTSVDPATANHFKLPGDNSGDYYFSEYDPTEGKKFYHKVEALSGATLRVEDPSMYGTLNNITGLKITPPEGIVQQEFEQPVQEEAMPVRDRLRSSNVVVKPQQIIPQNQQQVKPQQPAAVQGALSDDELNSYFKKLGGEMDEYEDGGIIDSFGHMIKLPKAYLKQYVDAGVVAGPGDGVGTLVLSGESKGNKIYTQTFGDGTQVVIVKDPSGNVIQQKAKAGSGEYFNLHPSEKLFRGYSEKLDPKTMTPEEIAYAKSKWGEKGIDAYGTFLNQSNKFRLDADLRKAMSEENKKMLADPEAGMYTGKDLAKRKYFQKLYGEDLGKMSDDELFASLMQMDEYNQRMKTLGLKPEETDQEAAAFKKGSRYYQTKDNPQAYHTNEQILEFQKAHPELKDLDFSKAHRSQTAYQAYVNALKRPEFKGYGAPQTGLSDENVVGMPGTVSGTESIWTNTSAGQNTYYTGKPEEEKISTVTPPEAKGKWYCVDGQVVQSTIDATTGSEIVPTGTKVDGPHNDQNTAAAICKIGDEVFIDKGIPNKSDGWFAPDIANYMTAVGQQTPFTLPNLQQMQTPPSGYDTLNPITGIASALSAQKQFSDQLSNTMDANTAAAAGANFDIDALAKIIGGVEDKNVAISNQNYDKIGQRIMAADQFNTQMRNQYNRDTATAIDERAKDYNAKEALKAKMFASGWGNAARDEGYRQMYPEAHHINRITGKYDMTNPGRNPFGPDVSTSSSGAGLGDPTAEAQAAYDRAYDAAIKANKSPEQATKLADLASKQAYNDHNYYRQKRKAQGSNPYAASVNSIVGGGRGYTPDYGATSSYDWE